MWTDSLVVLGWLRAEPTRWKDFVRHRVMEIQELVDRRNWRHCPGVDNLADLASRGANFSALLQRALWWNGPDWLRTPENNWPRTTSQNAKDSTEVESENLQEQRPVVALVCTNSDISYPFHDLLNKCSKKRRLVRVTAFILRFLKRLQRRSEKPSTNEGPIAVCVEGTTGKRVEVLSVTELQEALKFWIRRQQKDNFQSEIDNLRKGLHVSKRSAIVNLSPILDSTGVLWVAGRTFLYYFNFSLFDWRQNKCELQKCHLVVGF